MSALRRLALACGTWLVCQGAVADALDMLDACAAQATERARGAAALEAQCPGLGSALLELGLADALPERWRDSIDRGAVADLAHLARRYRNESTGAAPDTGALGAVLEQLEKERIKPKRSWWTAFTDWLRSWFASRDAGSVSWMERVLNGLAASADVIIAITYIVLGIVVIAAVWFIIRELRLAGWLLRRRAPDTAVVVAAIEAEPEPRDLDIAAPRDQPALLLRLLVARLRANGQLPQERSLTHRELVSRGTFADSDSRVCFERVSRLAERVMYGTGETNPQQAEAVIGDGRRLLLQLEATGVRA